MKLIIELLQEDAMICTSRGNPLSGATLRDLKDCNASGDCENACRAFIAKHKIEWRTVKMINASYKNVLASPFDKMAVCENIYFDSSANFENEDTANLYLIWYCAGQIE